MPSKSTALSWLGLAPPASTWSMPLLRRAWRIESSMSLPGAFTTAPNDDVGLQADQPWRSPHPLADWEPGAEPPQKHCRRQGLCFSSFACGYRALLHQAALLLLALLALLVLGLGRLDVPWSAYPCQAANPYRAWRRGQRPAAAASHGLHHGLHLLELLHKLVDFSSAGTREPRAIRSRREPLRMLRSARSPGSHRAGNGLWT